MSALAVRPAKGFDVKGVMDIAARRPFTARWAWEGYNEETMRADSLFLIADDGKVRGYIIARRVQDEAQLVDFAVDTEGVELGQTLWKALLKAAKERGAAKLTLEVSAKNARGIRFYERAGAVVVGRRAKFYNDGSDAILMDFPLP